MPDAFEQAVIVARLKAQNDAAWVALAAPYPPSASKMRLKAGLVDNPERLLGQLDILNTVKFQAKPFILPITARPFAQNVKTIRQGIADKAIGANQPARRRLAVERMIIHPNFAALFFGLRECGKNPRGFQTAAFPFKLPAQITSQLVVQLMADFIHQGADNLPLRCVIGQRTFQRQKQKFAFLAGQPQVDKIVLAQIVPPPLVVNGNAHIFDDANIFMRRSVADFVPCGNLAAADAVRRICQMIDNVKNDFDGFPQCHHVLLNELLQSQG